MQLLIIAGSSFVLGLSGACMPGPLLTVTINETLRRGAWAGPLLVLGHGLLEGCVVLLVLFGLGDWVLQPSVFGSIAIIGCLMLLWMGLGMLRGLPQLTLDLSGDKQSGLHPVVAGALVSLANPYFTLWWATVGLSYMVVAGEAGPIGVLVFYLFHVLSDLVWYAFISGSVSLGRNILTVRVYRGLVGFCAVFLLGFGLYFGWLGLVSFVGERL